MRRKASGPATPELLLPAALVLFAAGACTGADPAGADGSGSLRVFVTGAGSPADADGVEIRVDGGAPTTVDLGGQTLYEGLSAGEHVVAVSDVAEGCSAERGRTRPAEVGSGVTTSVTVAILCGDEQTILFWSARDAFGWSELYTVRPDGSNLRRLTSVSGEIKFSPTWSPDRTRLAYSRQREGEGVSLWVRELDGTEEIILKSAASGEAAGDPSWSPDGSRIAFFFRGDIWTVRPDGTGLELLQESGAEPAWSPDGSRIAFVRRFDGHADVMVMDADGTDVRNLTDTEGVDETGPAWSPAGVRLAFARRAPELSQIRTMAVDGSEDRLLLDVGGGQLVWSPSGARIAGILNLPQGSGLATLSPEGTEVRGVMIEDEPMGDPAW